MADPLGPPLPGAALGAVLHPQLMVAGALPVAGVEAVTGGNRRGEAFGQHVGGSHQPSASCVPKMAAEGISTMGPALTKLTLAFGTWFDESPRTWRAASTTRPRPCM